MALRREKNSRAARNAPSGDSEVRAVCSVRFDWLCMATVPRASVGRHIGAGGRSIQGKIENEGQTSLADGVGRYAAAHQARDSAGEVQRPDLLRRFTG